MAANTQASIIEGKSINPTRTLNTQGSVWNKVKSKVLDSKDSNGYSSIANGITADPITNNGLLNKLSKTGEILTYSLSEKRVQIWDWKKHGENYKNGKGDFNKMGDVGNYSSKTVGLEMVADLQFENDIVFMEPLKFNRSRSSYCFLVAFNFVDDNKSYVKWEVCTLKRNGVISSIIIDGPINFFPEKLSHLETDIEKFNELKYIVQSSKTHFVICDSFGSLNVYEFDTLIRLPLNLNCKVNDNGPVFNVQGSFLAYNSTKADSFNQKIRSTMKKIEKEKNSKLNIQNSSNNQNGQLNRGDYRGDGNGLSFNTEYFNYHHGKSNNSDLLSLTPLVLSKPNTLAKKIWKNLSKTAIDSASMIGEASQSKFMSLFHGDNDRKDEEMSKQKDSLVASQNFRETLIKILNTLSRDSNYIVTIDLMDNSFLYAFSPPDGCSHISLSPYDCLISTTTDRGDDIFIWDYTKYTTEIRLMEKLKRGRTSGIVEDIHWTAANRSFVLLSKLSGSIHCFANEFEELSVPRQKRHKKKPLFYPYQKPSSFPAGYGSSSSSVTDSWVISSMGARKITLGARSLLSRFNQQFIIALDASYVYLITIDGYIVAKYELPRALVEDVEDNLRYSSNPLKVSSKDPTVLKSDMKEKRVASKPIYRTSLNSMSQAIIEPCAPFVPLYNDRNTEIAVYKELDEDIFLAQEDAVTKFIRRVESFQPELEVDTIQFGRDSGKVLFYTDEEASVADLKKAMDNFAVS